jgi:lysophospholipase L1-like esterase
MSLTSDASGASRKIYTEGKDYILNHHRGTIARLTHSTIPDYSTHVLNGITNFDHNAYPDCSNEKWFVWADYQTDLGSPWAFPNDQRNFLTRTRRRLENGGPFHILTYGDSITAGGEASEPCLQFTHRFARTLETRFPSTEIGLQDISIPGYASQKGIDWFAKQMRPVTSPDLVLIGFGMNDHNVPEGGGVEPSVFQSNLVRLVELMRENTPAEIILFSACLPNPNWRMGTHRMEKFAAATRQAAADCACAYVDVYGTWTKVLQRKDPSSLLANNINHPNDFGHWLYAQAFESMTF